LQHRSNQPQDEIASLLITDAPNPAEATTYGDLEILFQDDDLVAVNKPSGWDVHRNEFNRHRPIVLQSLRNQINKEVHPIHRLDGGTSGVLLFATKRDVLRFMNDQFQSRETQKTYHCISRGFAKSTLCRQSLRVHDHTVEAETDIRCLSRIELPWPNERFPQSRYSFLELKPRTGRYHQIRRHLRDLGWPIVGDTKHGDSDHNRIWRERLSIHRLLLHASSLTIIHPDGRRLEIKAALPPEIISALELSGWQANTDLVDFHTIVPVQGP
jgi:tRNA pseudouridine65 synthase